MSETLAANDIRLFEVIERAERASKRWQPMLVLGAVLLTVAFVLLSIYLQNARQAAEAARDKAVAEAREKTQNANDAADALTAAQVALEAGDRAGALKAIRAGLHQQEEVAESALPNVSESVIPVPASGRSQSAQVASVLRDAVVTTDGNLRLDPYPPGKAYSVYLQFAGSITREQIVGLNHALREADWNVQGASGERIGTAAGLNEVRFSNDGDRAAAVALADALTKAGTSGHPVKARQLGIIKPGTLEVWISN